MKPMRIDLPKDLPAIEIHAMADIHLGDTACDYKAVQAIIERVKSTDNAYAILNGDLMDTAIASSVGDTYGANLKPMEQLEQCVKLFAPIKDKIICITHGNHENRVYKQDGIDLTAMMAMQLGLIDRYTPTTALLFVRLGNDKKHGRRYCYTIYATHGSGGGRREGGKVNRLADLASIVDADVFIHSHTHMPAVFKNAYYRVDTNNSTVSCVDKLFVNTAAVLDYGGYGDVQGFKPASKANPIIYLDGTRKKATATV